VVNYYNKIDSPKLAKLAIQAFLEWIHYSYPKKLK